MSDSGVLVPCRQAHLCQRQPARPGRGSDPAGALAAHLVHLPHPHRQAAQLHAEGTGGCGHQEGAQHR